MWCTPPANIGPADWLRDNATMTGWSYPNARQARASPIDLSCRQTRSNTSASSSHDSRSEGVQAGARLRCVRGHRPATPAKASSRPCDLPPRGCWLRPPNARAQACRRVAWADQRLAQAGSINAEGFQWLAAGNWATAEILANAIACYRLTARSCGGPGEP
jgi:hypothetical protein